jgi:subtilase family serine protease/flagellar hook assembly protein FlgD/fibronectin type 3 domain-containing protein
LPDLSVYSSDVSVTPPLVSQLPTTLHITGSMWNIGTVAVDAAGLALVQEVDGHDVVVATQTLAVAARSSTSFAFDYVVTEQGAVHLALIADPNQQIVEASRENNRAEVQIGAQPGVDLEVTNADLRVETTNPTTNRDIHFHIAFRNRGTNDAAVTHLVTTVDTGSGAVTIDDQQVQLNGGTSAERELTWRTATAGSYQLLVAIDPDNLVTETDESNNAAALTFAVASAQGPNLTLAQTDIAFTPDLPREGADLDVAVTVHNTGADTAGAFALVLYDGDPRTTGTQISQTQLAAGLAAGASTAANLHVTNLSLHGDHYFYAHADPGNSVIEQDETDNLAFRQVHVLSLPDLSLTPGEMVLAPTNPIPGQPTTLHATLRNLGEQPVVSASVQLLEGTPQSGATAGQMQTVTNLAGGGSTDVSWSWNFGVYPGADRLTVIADPTNAVRESNESNNNASIPLNVQNGDLFVTERYISPNGDGVQDNSTIVVRSGVGAYARMDVVNSLEETVRSFAAATIAAGGGQAVWDGRDDVGRIVRDGDYRVIIRQSDDSFVSQTMITVDNNRAPLADAIVTTLQRDQWLNFRQADPQTGVVTKIIPYTTSNGRPSLLVMAPYDVINQEQLSGLYRTTLGDLQPVLSSRWIDQHAAEFGGTVDIWDAKVSSLAPVAALVLLNRSANNSNGSLQVVLVNFENIDDVRILPAQSNYSFNVDFVSATLCYVAYSNSQGQKNHVVIDLTDGSQRTLFVDGGGSAAVYHSRLGLYVYADDGIHFIPFAADGTPSIVQNVYSKFDSSTIAWAPGDGGQIATLDAENAKVVLFSIDTGAVREYPLPVDATAHQYATTTNEGSGRTYDFTGATPSFDYIQVPDHPSTGNNVVWSWDGSHILIAFGETVTGHLNPPCQFECPPSAISREGVTRVLDLDLYSGATTELARYTQWPAGDLAPSPQPWDYQKTVLEKDGRFTLFPIDGGRGLVYQGALVSEGDTGIYRARHWPSGIEVSQYDAQTGITSSLQNLTAHLEAISLGTTFILQGIATDKNFAYFQLEWASETQPDNWQPITDPITDSVVDDEFMWWSPPVSGSLLVRLRVVDKAGNQTTDTIRVLSISASPIGRLTVAPRYISPNGDGVQDEATISFNVREPTTVNIDVLDAQGTLVRRFQRQYGDADLGAQTESWDGRNEAGQRVPDGKYYVSVGNSRFTVIVDTALPTLADLQMSEPYQKQPHPGAGMPTVVVVPGLSWKATDANLATMDIEFGLGNQPSQWYLYDHRDASISDLPSGLGITVANFRDDSFRITVRDKAGNQVRASFVKPTVGDGRLIFASVGDRFGCTPLGVERQALPYQVRPFLQNAVPTGVLVPETLPRSDLIPLTVFDAIPERIQQLWLEARPATDQPWSRIDIPQEQLAGDPGAQLRLAVPVSAIFADPTKEYEVRIVAISGAGETVISNATVFVLGRCGVGGGGGSGGGGPPGPPDFKVRVSPLSGPVCGGVPTNSLLLEVAIPQLPQSNHLSATYKNPLTGQPVTLLDVENPQLDASGLCQFPYFAVMDLSGLPEGQISVTVRLDFVDGTHSDNIVDVPVDHTPAQVRINVPGDGQKVCVDLKQNPIKVPVLGMASDQVGFGYRLQFSSAQQPNRWNLIHNDGYTEAGPSCYDHLPHLSNFALHDVDGQLGDMGQSASFDPKLFNGAGTLQLVAADWSGALVCTNNNIYFDTDVDAKIDSINPILPWHTGPQRIGISLAPDSTQSVAHVHVLSHEPATADIEIHPIIVTAGGDWTSDDSTVLGITQTAVPVNGIGDLTWDGRLGGNAVPDGDYSMVLVLHDDCIHSKKFVQFVTVDSTPPELSITQPALGDHLSNTVVEVLGTANDAYFDRYVLDFSSDGNTWQAIASSFTPVDPAALLGDWVLSTSFGSFTLRLQAFDRLGNHSTVLVPLTRPQPVGLLLGITLQPNLISPNGDGQFDQANLTATLGRDAVLSVTVTNASSQIVTTLVNSELRGRGAQALPWDGRTSGGAAVPDGDYLVNILATEPNDTTIYDAAQLTLAVDTTPPLLQLSTPADASYSNGKGSVRFQTSDPHILTVHAKLTGGDSTAPVAIEFNDARSGTFDVASLATLPEGNYQVALDATDKAANASHASAQFVLDRTPPVATIVAPIEGQVIAGASAFKITGSASDTNFDHYELAYASAQAPNSWTLIATSPIAVDSDVLTTWTPAVPDGNYRLRLRAYDKANNITETAIGVAVDGTPPVVQITAPVNGALVKGDFAVIGTAKDDHLSEYRISIATVQDAAQGLWSDLSSRSVSVDNGTLGQIQLALPDGTYVLRVRAKDVVGLTASAQVQIRLDRTPPPVPIGLTAQAIQNRDVQLNWTPVNAEDLAGYYVYRGGVRITSNLVSSAAYLDANAPEGNLSYQVSAVDQAGNESEWSDPATAIIDHTAPTHAIASPQTGARVRGLIDISGTAYSIGDFKDYQLSVQATVPPGASTTIVQSILPVKYGKLGQWDTGSVADETHVHITLTAEDVYANAGTSAVDIIVDNAPPAAPTGLVAVLAGDDVQVNWNPNTESDLLGYLLYRGGQLVGWSGNVPLDLRAAAITLTNALDKNVPDGTLVYTVYAIDQAGNISLPSAPASVTPNRRAPEVTIVTPHNGYRFTQTLHVIAQSPDLDVVSVQFSYRPAAGGTWTPIGAAATTLPYEAFWTPGNLPFGDYQITAVATDQGGLTTVIPPVVQVHYATSTLPPQVTGLSAQVDGDTAKLSWQAVSTSDLAGYILVRTDASGNEGPVNGAPITDTHLNDSGLADSSYTYRVYAVDHDNNAGPRSDPVSALVFTPQLDQPYTPTQQVAVRLTGTSPVAGRIGVTVTVASSTTSMDGGTTDVAGPIHVDNIALLRGDNTLAVRITDVAGNISKPATVIVSYDSLPQAPTGLTASANGNHVSTQWNANTEDNILGYRLVRRDHAVWPDVPLAQSLGTFSASEHSERAIDGDTNTAWVVYPTAGSSTPFAALGLDWNSAAIVAAVHLQWSSTDSRASAYRLEAWNDVASAWITVATASGNANADNLVQLAEPYRTRRLRLWPVAGSLAGAAVSLAEISVIERPVQNATSFDEDLIDGQYGYTVSAVNAYAFESAPSQPASVAIGDATPPDAVTLGVSVSGSDAHLSWTPSTAPDLAGYLVYRNGVQVTSLTAAQVAYVDANLANGHYSYYVVAFDNYANTSANSNTVAVDISTSAPGIPVGIAVTAPIAGRALDIAWQPGAGSTPAQYALYRGLTAQGPFAPVVQTAALNFHDAPLVNGTTYFYTVAALDAAGNASGQSAVASGTPRDVQPPGPPDLYYPTVPSWPIQLDQAQTEVQGSAEPGSFVDLLVNGTKVDTQRSLSVAAIDTIDNVYAPALSVSPNGGWAWGGAQVIDLIGGTTLSDTFSTNAIGWSPDSRYFLWADGTLLQRHQLETEQSQPLDVGVTQPQFGFVAPDGAHVLIGGMHDNGGSPVAAVWLIKLGDQTVTRRFDVDPGTLDATTFAWSPDGSHFAFRSLAGSVLIAAVASGSMTSVLDQVLPGSLTWSADGGAIAVSRDDAVRNAVQVVIYSVAAQTQVAFAASATNQWKPVFAPDGRSLAFIADAKAIEVHAWPDGALTASYPLPGASGLAWPTQGRIVAATNSSLLRISQPGFVQFHDVAIPPGTNVLIAQATDAAGNLGLPSLPLMVTRTSAGLPDLAVTNADVRFVPAVGQVGHDYSASITVSNLGDMPSTAVNMALTLTGPDGIAHAIDPTWFDTVDSGASRVVAVDLGVLTQAGLYQLQVQIDPANTLAEASKSNNAATGTLVLTTSGAPLLELATAQTVFAPDAAVNGTIAVTAAGTSFDGVAVVTVEDAQGAHIADISTDALSALGVSQRWTRPVTWMPSGDTFAGAYQLHAVLRDKHAAIIAERIAPFQIGSVSHIQLAVAGAQDFYAPGAGATVNMAVNYSSGNALLGNAQLVLSVTDAGGGEVLHWQRALGDLLPGYRAQLSTLWPIPAGASGVYTLNLSLQSGSDTYASTASIQVVPATPSVAVGGTIALKVPPLALGRPAIATYGLRNLGQQALVALPVRVRLVAVAGLADVATAQVQVDLASGASTTADADVSSSALTFGSYLLVLEAQVPGTPAGSWSRLAQVGVQALDLAPPAVSILVPVAGSIAGTPIAASIRAVDADSRVDRVEASVDGGAWATATLQGDATYLLSLVGLADGTHGLLARATDAWGNQATSTPQSFIVDNTAPLITISNVSDGELTNQAVAPIVSITDAHLTSSTIELNGAPFVSGTTIAADGNYALRVSARDSVTNNSTRVVHFTIDRTAPTLTFLSPADGSTITQDQVNVVTLSEAGMRVELERGIYASAGNAGPDAHYTFAAVPLDVGDNLVRARAIDAAGNSSAWASLHLTRTATGANVTGTLTASGNQVGVGAALTLHYVVGNATQQSLSSLPVRLRVVHVATTNTLTNDAFTIDVPAQASTTGQRDYATDGWPLGAYIAYLDSDLSSIGGAGGWAALDSTTLSLVDLTPPLLNVSVPVAQQYFSGAITVAATVHDVLSDIASVEMRLDNGAWTALALLDAASGHYQAAPQTLPDAAHVCDVRATDTAGNITHVDGIVFYVDTIAPLINIAGVADGERMNQNVVPVITVTDASPVTSTTTLDGTAFASGTQVTIEGAHLLVANAIDAAGNSSNRQLHFTIDRTGPALTISSPADGATLAQNPIHITGQTESLAGVDVQTGNFSAHVSADAQGHFDVAGVLLAAGSNTISAHATDDLGNIGTTASVTVTYAPATNASISGHLALDPAQVAFDAAFDANYTIVNSGVAALSGMPLRITVATAGTGQSVAQRDFTIDVVASGQQSATTNFATTGWALGDYQVTLLAQVHDAQDAPVWVTLDSQTLRVADTTPPLVTVMTPAAGAYFNADVPVQANATDALSVIVSAEVQVDSGLWQPLAAGVPANVYEATLAQITEGDHVLRARAQDTWTNTAISADVPFHVDRTAPQITISGVDDGTLYNHSVAATIVIQDASPLTQQITLDGAAYISNNAIATEGVHHLHVHALDAAGNEAQNDVGFTIDTTPPAVDITAPSDGAVLANASVDVLGVTEAQATVDLVAGAFTAQVQADAQGAFIVTGVSLVTGANTIKARATDRASNIGEWVQVTVTRALPANSCHNVVDRIFANGFDGAAGLFDAIFCDGFEARSASSAPKSLPGGLDFTTAAVPPPYRDRLVFVRSDARDKVVRNAPWESSWIAGISAAITTPPCCQAGPKP